MSEELQESVATILLEGVGEELEQEWKALYHNASISYPDIDDDAEWEMFWEELADEARWLINDLETLLREEFNETLTLYQYGRGGATIAPSDFTYSSRCGAFGSYDDGRWSEIIEDDPVAALKTAQTDLKILKLINERVRSAAAGIPDWWKEVRTARLAA